MSQSSIRRGKGPAEVLLCLAEAPCVPVGWVHSTGGIPVGAALPLPALIAQSGSGLAVCACVCSGLDLCALCVFRAALCAQGCSMCPGCSYGWLCVPWLCSEMLCVPVSGSVPGQAQGSHAPVLCVCLGRFVLLGKPTLPVLCSLSLLAAASQDVSAHQGSQTLP